MGEQETSDRSLADEPADISNDRPDVPGALRGEVWLTVQSRHAQRLIMGRAATAEKPAIIGLVGFADRLRVIWNSARADDPYADWWLIRIDEALERARRCVKDERVVLDERLKQDTSLQISVATSHKPYRVQLQFANPYAYWGAQLVAEFDVTARTILTARHIGLLCNDDADALLRGTGGAIRGLFAVPQGYRVFHIDRAAVRAGDKSAQDAAEIMGEVPVDVLSGERAAALTPRKASQ